MKINDSDIGLDSDDVMPCRLYLRGEGRYSENNDISGTVEFTAFDKCLR